ncbi:MAG: hypothetical protein PUC37_06070 [Spirochaetales bacterium]|nr:hypothetical protein [Spirochaetales bacterium]
MEKIQYGTIRIGQIVKLFVDGIGFDALLDSVPESEKESTKKWIQRLEDEEGRIDNLRQFERLLKDFFKNCLDNNYINKAQSTGIQMFYYDMLALITKTNPYNNPTQKEVELQVMYCIALTFRELYDDIATRDNNPPGYILQEALYFFNFWRTTSYQQNLKLIPSCFDFIFSLSENPKADLIKLWEDTKDNQENDKGKTSYLKTINDWTEKGVNPTWKNIKPILASKLPDTIEIKESKYNYEIFKYNLFSACFLTRFFKSLEEQYLVSENFKETVQNGLRWFYYYAFEKHGDFTTYKDWECKNPMFSLMRFLVHPSPKNRSLVSDLIYEAFDKEIGLTPVGMYECKSLYYIPIERIHFPVIEYSELQDELDIHSIIYQTNIQLSTWSDFGFYKNKEIKQEDLEYTLNLPIMGECRNFYYNWFMGKYFVLCHEFEKGLDFYKKAFEYRYFGGKVLCMYLEEFIVLMEKCKSRKIELNHVHEWANALRLYIYETDKYKSERTALRNSFEEVFPEEAFIM